MKKNILFLTSTILLLAVIFFCFSATAYSQSVERSSLADKEEIDLQEQALLEEMKQVMKEYGCEYDKGLSGGRHKKLSDTDSPQKYFHIG